MYVWYLFRKIYFEFVVGDEDNFCIYCCDDVLINYFKLKYLNLIYGIKFVFIVICVNNVEFEKI